MNVVSIWRTGMYEVRSSRGMIGAPPVARAMFGNQLLDALPRDEVARLSPHVRRVFLHRGQTLAVPGEPSEFIYFPIDSLLWSWTATTGADRPTSLLTTGRRGVMSLDSLLDVPVAHGNVSVLSPGSAWRVPQAVLETAWRSMD